MARSAYAWEGAAGALTREPLWPASCRRCWAASATCSRCCVPRACPPPPCAAWPGPACGACPGMAAGCWEGRLIAAWAALLCPVIIRGCTGPPSLAQPGCSRTTWVYAALETRARCRETAAVHVPADTLTASCSTRCCCAATAAPCLRPRWVALPGGGLPVVFTWPACMAAPRKTALRVQHGFRSLLGDTPACLPTSSPLPAGPDGGPCRAARLGGLRGPRVGVPA